MNKRKLCSKHKCQDTHKKQDFFNMNKGTISIKLYRQDTRDINIYHKEYGTKIY